MRDNPRLTISVAAATPLLSSSLAPTSAGLSATSTSSSSAFSVPSLSPLALISPAAAEKATGNDVMGSGNSEAVEALDGDEEMQGVASASPRSADANSETETEQGGQPAAATPSTSSIFAVSLPSQSLAVHPPPSPRKRSRVNSGSAGTELSEIPLEASATAAEGGGRVLDSIQAGTSSMGLRRKASEKRYRDEITDEDEDMPPEADKAKAADKPGLVQGPAFPKKLYQLVTDETVQHLVAFTEAGDSIIVFDPDPFAAVLKKHFKHSNFASFIRQLNNYGFSKVTKAPRGTKSSETSWEFMHPSFKRGDLDGIAQIKRKAPTRSPTGEEEGSTRKKGRRRSSADACRPPALSELGRGEASAEQPVSLALESPLAPALGSTARPPPPSGYRYDEPNHPTDGPLKASTVSRPPQPWLGGQHYGDARHSVAAAAALRVRPPPSTPLYHNTAPVPVAPAPPPPIAVPSAPRLRQLSGPFPPSPFASGFTGPASPAFPQPSPVHPSGSFVPASHVRDSIQAIRNERDELLALTRRMHKDLLTFHRQLEESRERCSEIVGLTGQLKAMAEEMNGGQPLGNFPSYIFDSRFPDPSVPLAVIQADASRALPPPHFVEHPSALPPFPSPQHYAGPHSQPYELGQPLSSPNAAHLSSNPPFPPLTEESAYEQQQQHLHIDTQHVYPVSSPLVSSDYPIQNSAEEQNSQQTVNSASSGSAAAARGLIGLGIEVNGAAYPSDGMAHSGHWVEHPESAAAVAAAEFAPEVPQAQSQDFGGQDHHRLSSHISSSSLNSFAGPASSSAGSSPQQTAWTYVPKPPQRAQYVPTSPVEESYLGGDLHDSPDAVRAAGSSLGGMLS
ncbi:hypothetical protein JCM10213_003317 [Rhodosporidiobolus nylandii]